MMNKDRKTNCINDYRPLFHYTCRKGWMNDPNGLIYYDGYYHLYYQHDPYRVLHDGAMHWGHARSINLTDWEELPVSIEPDSKGEIFSGCIVRDKNNTSGFGKDNIEPLVAVFTQNYETSALRRQYQSLAYSLDGGITFTKYKNNPVLDLEMEDFRDPKVFWYEQTGKWIMLVAAGRKVMIFSSINLKEWSKESVFITDDLGTDEIWECPDLFYMKLKSGIGKWIMVVSQNTLDYKKTGIRYFIGEFNGSKFLQDKGQATKKFLDFGRDNYAAATFQETGRRRIQISWMNCWAYAQKTPETDYRGIMTVPRELFLEKVGNEIYVGQKPVPEVMNNFNIQHIDAKRYEEDKLNGIYNLKLHSEKGKIWIRNSREYIVIGFDYKAGTLYVDRKKSGFIPGPEFGEIKKSFLNINEQKEFWIIIDTSSVEIFSGSGKVSGSFLYYAENPFQVIEVITEA